MRKILLILISMMIAIMAGCMRMFHPKVELVLSKPKIALLLRGVTADVFQLSPVA